MAEEQARQLAAADVLADVDPPAGGGTEQFRRDLRIAGVLVGQAVGDALGVPYEGGDGPEYGQARMTGGGFGGYGAGQWSGDTECAVMVARAGAEPLAVAENLLRWYASKPPDIGPTSRAVLGQAKTPGQVAEVARQVAKGKVPGEAGSGSLMRTAPVALAHLGDRARIAEVARGVSDLTHADPWAADACTLWCEAIGRAVELGGAFSPAMVSDGLEFIPGDRRETWRDHIDAVLTGTDVRRLRLKDNGTAAGAFRAALWAVAHSTTYSEGVQRAVSLGNDTDTVAAIAGALLGGWYGLLEIPALWYRKVHGWPAHLDARGLGRLALVTAGRARVQVDSEADVPENYHLCKPGHGRHWGPDGAAGVIPLVTCNGEQYILLSHRSRHVQQGSCWSTLGGAIEPDEDALAAALREAREEVTGLPRHGEVIAEVDAPCAQECGWSYRTFVVEFSTAGLPKVRVRSAHAWETDDLRWVPAGEVGKLELHPGFRQTWEAELGRR